MEFLTRIIKGLFAVGRKDYHQLPDLICRVMLQSVLDLKFASLLTYNRQTDGLIYRSVTLDDDACDISQITELVKPNIVVHVDKSTSGRLIRDEKVRFLRCVDVMADNDYQSRGLAERLGLSYGVFLKLRDIMDQEIYGVLILYPRENCDLTRASDSDLHLIIDCIESVVSNAKRIKEHGILTEILDVASQKVGKDLNSFLHKSAQIISREIGAKGVSIFVTNPVEQRVKLRATLGIVPGPALPRRDYRDFKLGHVYYQLGEGLTGRVAQSNRPEVRHEMKIDRSKWVEKEMTNTFLVVPISKIDEDKALGVIRCATRPNKLCGDKIEAFNHEDLQVVTYIASLLSAFIEIAFFREQQKQLITKMPHEIRSALNNIISICDYLLLKHQQLKDQRRVVVPNLDTKLNDIMDECYLSLLTVDSLDAFEDSIESYEFELTDIFSDIIAKVRKMLSPMARETRGIDITYDSSVRLPPLYLDPRRMQIVMHNLLINAIKYSDSQISSRDGAKSGLHDIVIRSGFSKERNSFTLSVANFGIPIPLSQGRDIFFYGYRTMEAIRKDPGGRGLGLTLSEHILRVHNSSIDVTGFSSPTELTIFFPVGLREKCPTEPSKEVRP